MILKDWITPARTALLLVDMQVDFAAPDGAMGKSGMDLSMVGHALRNAVLLTDAARAAGEWQTLEATFRAARFDGKGEKSANAKIVKASLNGQVIHEDQEMKTPTGSNWVKKEMKEGPFMLQCDHGPVAFRNVRIRAVKE